MQTFCLKPGAKYEVTSDYWMRNPGYRLVIPISLVYVQDEQIRGEDRHVFVGLWADRSQRTTSAHRFSIPCAKSKIEDGTLHAQRLHCTGFVKTSAEREAQGFEHITAYLRKAYELTRNNNNELYRRLAGSLDTILAT